MLDRSKTSTWLYFCAAFAKIEKKKKIGTHTRGLAEDTNIVVCASVLAVILKERSSCCTLMFSMANESWDCLDRRYLFSCMRI